jgi:DUF1680 family protein
MSLTKEISRRDFLKTATKTTAKVAIGAAGVSAVLATLQSTASAAGTVVNQWNFDGNLTAAVGGVNATGVGSPTYITGHAGQGVSFNGTAGQYATLPAGIVSARTTCTIAFWIRVATQVTWARAFDFGSSTTVNMFFVPSNGANARFAITTSGSGGEQQINAGSALATGSWQHVAITLNGATGTLYVNGAQVGQNTGMTLNPSSLGSTTLNYFGKSQYADGNLNGALDDFRIYNGALTASEVATLYGGVVNTATPAPPTSTPLPSGSYLSLMYPEAGWRLNSNYWNGPVKAMIVTWVPYCYGKLNASNCAEGGIQNLIEEGRRLDGLSHALHVGLWFSNAYVYNVLQSMVRAVMIDPQGDTAISSAQSTARTRITSWNNTIINAQSTDGYIHTWTTLNNRARWVDRAGHEGYTMGYLMETGLAHYQQENFTNPALYNVAIKVADCWWNNIGPSPKKTWWDGHQEMEQAMTRFSRFVGSLGDSTRAGRYAGLGKFLLDVRQGGSQYDQSHALPINQTTAVGHAVRAMYMYSAMTDVAMLNNSSSYFNACNALWANFVDRKYYLTGGPGSGATSEGFGNDYVLPNNSYCETCAGCGSMFFQHMMHLAYANGKYVDLMEECLYNNVVGTMNLGGTLYNYTNPLNSGNAKISWHSCPCCVGNFPRVIFTMPSWMYSKSGSGLYVNLYIGSTVTFRDVFGTTDVTLTQATNYPWDGTVTLTVSPSVSTNFTLYVRSPQRSVSTAYSSSPTSDGISSLTVNGAGQSTTSSNGYVAINRTWNSGDQVVITLPLAIQRVTAISNIAANVGLVALQRGPVIYVIESADQSTTLVLPTGNALTATWDGALLGGVTKITGQWSTGAALTAIPWYKRCNRGGSWKVWFTKS